MARLISALVATAATLAYGAETGIAPPGMATAFDDMRRAEADELTGDVVWGVNSNDDIWYRAGLGGGWRQIGGKLKQMAASGEEVWGVNSADDIWYRKGPNGSWRQIAGKLKHVSVSGENVWGVNRNDDIYYREGPNGAWRQIPGKLKQIEVSGENVWGVNSNDDIYYRNGVNGAWKHIGGKLKHVSVSGDNVWGVNSNDDIYYRKGVNGAWRHIPGKLKQIDVVGDHVWGVNSADNIYYRNGVDGAWRQIGGKLKHVTVSGLAAQEPKPAGTLKRSFKLRDVEIAKEFKLAFEVTPYGTVSGWNNLLHVTADNTNIDKMGSRAPGIWFHSGTTKMHVCAACDGNRNTCLNPARALPLGKKSEIAVTIKNGLFAVFIDGEQAASIKCAAPFAPKAGTKAILYASDPWYAPANAKLENIEYTPFEAAAKAPEGTLKKATKLKEVEISKEFKLDFEVTPYGTVSGWNNLLHMTADNTNGDKMGSRIPGVWFHSGTTKMHVCAGCDGNKNTCLNPAHALPLGKKSEIAVTIKNGLFAVSIDGDHAASVKCAAPFAPKAGTKAILYASDPWYAAANAKLENIEYTPFEAAKAPEGTLKKNTMVKELEIAQEFKLDFEVTPYGAVSGWNNLLHVTADNTNGDKMGSRAPGVWFHSGTTKLHVCAGCDGNRNTCLNPETALPVGRKSEISVSIEKGVFAVSINGKGAARVKCATPFAPKAGAKAKLYASDPWYAPANAKLENIDYTPLAKAPEGPKGNLESKNELMDVDIAPHYQLDFDVTPLGTVTGWNNVLHLTADGENIKTMGSRAPGVWFHSGTTKLHVCAGCDGNMNTCLNPKEPLPLKEKSALSVKLADGEFALFVNEEKVAHTRCAAPFMPKDGAKATLYASDPWYAPSNAVLENVKYTPLLEAPTPDPTAFPTLRPTIKSEPVDDDDEEPVEEPVDDDSEEMTPPEEPVDDDDSEEMAPPEEPVDDDSEEMTPPEEPVDDDDEEMTPPKETDPLKMKYCTRDLLLGFVEDIEMEDSVDCTPYFTEDQESGKFAKDGMLGRFSCNCLMQLHSPKGKEFMKWAVPTCRFAYAQPTSYEEHLMRKYTECRDFKGEDGTEIGMESPSVDEPAFENPGFDKPAKPEQMSLSETLETIGRLSTLASKAELPTKKAALKSLKTQATRSARKLKKLTKTLNKALKGEVDTKGKVAAMGPVKKALKLNKMAKNAEEFIGGVAEELAEGMAEAFDVDFEEFAEDMEETFDGLDELAEEMNARFDEAADDMEEFAEEFAEDMAEAFVENVYDMEESEETTEQTNE